jgi:hypothetical protein
MNAGWAEVNSSGTVSVALVDEFWQEMSGSLVQVSLGIGYVVEIALILTTPFDLEGSFVVPILGSLVSAGLGTYPGLPQLTLFNATNIHGLQAFLGGLAIPSIYLNTHLYTDLSYLAAGASGVAALCGWQFFQDQLTTFIKSGATGAGPAALGGILFAATILALVMDVYGFIHDSVTLIFLGILFSLIGAGVAGILVYKGGSEVFTPTLSEYLTSIALCGGLSAGADVGKLLS